MLALLPSYILLLAYYYEDSVSYRGSTWVSWASGSTGSNLCTGSNRKFADPVGSRGDPGSDPQRYSH